MPTGNLKVAGSMLKSGLGNTLRSNFSNEAEQSIRRGGPFRLKTCKPNREKEVSCFGEVDIRRMPGSFKRKKELK